MGGGRESFMPNEKIVSHEYLCCIICSHPFEVKVYGDPGFDDAIFNYFCGNLQCKRFGLVTEVFAIKVYTEQQREEFKNAHSTGGDISEKN